MHWPQIESYYTCTSVKMSGPDTEQPKFILCSWLAYNVVIVSDCNFWVLGEKEGTI